MPPFSELGPSTKAIHKLKKFIPFTKVDEALRLVYGLVTAEIPDQDDEVMDYATTAPYYKALNARFEKATNGKSIAPLREMHQLSAVGVGKSIVFDDKAKSIHMAFKVVDDDAWLKVTEGVYTGFSQGGGYVKKWKVGDLLHYTADPTEISLVDNPCLAEATYEYVKADGTQELRKFALPKKSDPVDLVSLVHLDKLKSQAKSTLSKGMYSVQEMGRIIESIKWLQTDVLYERDYEGDDSPMPEQLAQILRDTVACFLQMAEEETTELLAALGKGVSKMTPEEIKALEDKVTKAVGIVTKAKATMKALHDHLGKGMEMCKALMGDDEEGDTKKAAGGLAPAPDPALKKTEDAVPMTKEAIADLVKAGVAEALAKVKADALEAETSARVKGTLVPRDESQLGKSIVGQDAGDLRNAGL